MEEEVDVLHTFSIQTLEDIEKYEEQLELYAARSLLCHQLGDVAPEPHATAGTKLKMNYRLCFTPDAIDLDQVGCF